MKPDTLFCLFRALSIISSQHNQQNAQCSSLDIYSAL